MAALQVKKAKKKSSKSGKKRENTDSEGDILRLEDVLDLGGSKVCETIDVFNNLEMNTTR